MNRKNLTIGLWIVLLAIIVYAAAPTTPSVVSPSNSTNYFSNVNLTCSGSTDGDGDDFNYLFWYNYNATENVLLANSTSSNFTFHGFTPSTDWAIVHSGTAPTFTLGGSVTTPNKLKGGDGTNNATATYTFTSNYTYMMIGAEGTGTTIIVRVDGTQILSVSNSGGYVATWRKLDTHNYTDGATHQLTIETNPADNVNDYIGWWLNPINVTWSCQAEDNTSATSNNVTRWYTPMTFDYCMLGDNVALNLTFEGENNTGTKIAGNLNNVLFTFVSDDVGNYSYTHQNSNNSLNYTFCMYPNETSIYTVGTISYSASGYPVRTSSIGRYLNGSYMFEKTLYLLADADGIYSTIQVADSTTQDPIPNVNVVGQKQISGIWTEVVSGITDDAGTVTFWVDPNAPHRFTFTKAGYTSATTTITPTQSIYTQKLVSTSTTVNQSDYYQGIKWEIFPTEVVLGSNTLYNFSFNLTSNYWNLSTFGFTLVNSSGDTLIDLSNDTATGYYLNQTYNTTSNSKLTMYYYWVVDGNTINNSYFWQVRNTTQGDASLAAWAEDVANFNAGGSDDFSKTIGFLFIFVIIIGTLIYFAGDSGYIEYTLMMAAIGLLWFGEWANLIPTLGTKYLITIIVGLVVASYVITDNIR